MSLARQSAGLLAALILTLTALSPAALAAQPATPPASPWARAEVCAVPHRDLASLVVALQPPPVTSPEAHANHAVAAGAETHHATDVPSTDAEHDHGMDDHHRPASSDATPFEPVGTPRLLQPELPEGTPVGDDSTIVAGLTETMHRYLACANAGDVIGLMSLVTPEFLRYSFGMSLLTEADLEAYAAAGQALPPEQRRRLIAIREPRLLPDGRVVALVDSAPVGSTNSSAIDTDLITFAETDGRYYIDRYLAGVTFWLGPNATPTP